MQIYDMMTEDLFFGFFFITFTVDCYQHNHNFYVVSACVLSAVVAAEQTMPVD